MNNYFIWIIVIIVSTGLGYCDSRIIYGSEKMRKYMDFFRLSLGYIFAGTILYYFLAFRWPLIVILGDLSIEDFILSLFFLFGVLGWIPNTVKKLSEISDGIAKKYINSK